MARTNISIGPMTQFCNERKSQHALVAEDLVQFLISHLGERRIHHHDQSRRNRNGGCTDVEAIQERHDSGHEPTQYTPPTMAAKIQAVR